MFLSSLQTRILNFRAGGYSPLSSLRLVVLCAIPNGSDYGSLQTILPYGPL